MMYRTGQVFVGALLVMWLIAPALKLWQPTSRDVSVTLVAAPFVDSPTLKYTWKGYVFRSCPVEIRRKFIDSNGVVTNMVATNRGRLPSEDLGPQVIEVTVEVPEQIAEGPAVYQATEISQCDWLQRLFPKPFDYPPVEFTVTR